MDDVEKIKQKIDIVDLVGEYIPLKKTGRNFKASCPFHADKTPSFVVSPERQIWHCFGCFPPDEKIKTPFGFHEIQEINTNHWIVSGKGNFQKVSRVMMHEYTGTLIKVQTRKLNSVVRLTADHTVFVVRGSPSTKQYKNFSKRYLRYLKIKEINFDQYYRKVNKYFPIQKLSAGQLQLGDLLLYPIRRIEREITSLNLKSYLTKATHFGPQPKNIPLEIPVDTNFLKLIGYWIAEGSNHRAYIRFSLGNHEEDFAKEIVYLIKKVFKLEAKIHRRVNVKKTGIEITACHAPLANIFENLCGKGAANKHIPFILQDLPHAKQRAILDAIFKGDGYSFVPHRSKNRHKAITTVSRVLSEQLVDTLLRLNLFPTLTIQRAKVDRKSVHHKEAYSVFWSEEATQKYKLIYYLPDGTEYWLLPIVELSQEQYRGPVYNFTVANDHSYVATNFAVANCGKGGDAFTFLMEYEKVDFVDALRFLAKRVGVTLQTSPARTEREKKREKLFALNHLAEQFYAYILLEHAAGKKARDYLTDTRRVPLGLIKKFNLGFAPHNPTILIEYLTRKKKYSEEDIVDAGLGTRKGKQLVDFFSGRIIFPIYDARGNVLAFSARATDDNALPKYINTRETLIYKKGQTLFGLNLALPAIKTGKKVIIVEGEFDVISAFREGIENVVAVKGTALTSEQIDVLKRYTPHLVFCFDTDPAGTAAQRRALATIEERALLASVIVLPHGKDPDELLQSDPILFKRAMKNETNIYDFIITSAISERDAQSIEGKRAILDKTLIYLAKIENEVIREHYLKKLADALDTSLEAITHEAQKLTEEKRHVAPPIATKVISRQERLEEYLLSLILQAHDPLLALKVTEKITSPLPFSIEPLEKLVKELVDYSAQSEAFSIPDFIKALPAELLDTFDRCYLAPLPPFKTEAAREGELVKTAQEVRRLSIKKRLEEVGQEMKEKEKTHDELGLTALQNEFLKLTELLAS